VQEVIRAVQAASGAVRHGSWDERLETSRARTIRTAKLFDQRGAA
jgi:hypothetical protein